MEQFRQSALQIAAGPLRWPLYHRAARRFVMSRFPYVIYFELKHGLIRILRVVHASRDPGPVKKLFD